MLLAGCWLARDELPEATAVLDAVLPLDAAERGVMRLRDLGSEELARASARDTFIAETRGVTYVGHHWALRLELDRRMGTENWHRLNDEHLLTSLGVSRPNARCQVRFPDGSQLGQRPAPPIEVADVALELVVNDRGEAVLFNDAPAWLWRDDTYLAIAGNRLVISDGRGGLYEFGLPIDERLLQYLTGGARILVVSMDRRSGQPLNSYYFDVYDWEGAAVTPAATALAHNGYVHISPRPTQE